MDQGRQERDQVDTAVVQDVRGQRRAAPTSCARLQSWQLSPHACNTGADQGLVADELEGEADQDRPTDAMSSSKWRRSPSHDKCSRRFCGCSRNYGRSHHPRQHEAFDCHAFKRNRQEESVQMPVKIARSTPQPSFGLPELLVASHITRSGFQGRCKIATLHAGFGVIRGMSVKVKPDLKTLDGTNSRAPNCLAAEAATFLPHPSASKVRTSLSFVEGRQLCVVLHWRPRWSLHSFRTSQHPRQSKPAVTSQRTLSSTNRR